VPDLGHNLLSCARLASKGIVCKFDKIGCTLVDTQDGDEEFCRATRRVVTRIHSLPGGLVR
jgi:hypothetical protein